jgi:hypothetical protein
MMINRDLAIAIDNVRKATADAQVEFNQATGLYVDAYTYKLMYLEALSKALMEDFKKNLEEDRLERIEAILREESDSNDNTT